MKPPQAHRSNTGYEETTMSFILNKTSPLTYLQLSELMAVSADVILINDNKTLPSSTFWYHF